MLTLTRAKPTKRSALRNAEYYDFQDVLDKLYADSENGCQFQQLTALNLQSTKHYACLPQHQEKQWQ